MLETFLHTLDTFSHMLEYIGLKIIPISTLCFIFGRLLGYWWNKEFRPQLLKSIWYFAMGLLYLQNDPNVGTLVTAICFVEAFDLYFQHLELKK